MATILTKKSDTASAVPLAADLTNAAGGAELAVNATDKRLFSKTSGGTVVELGTNPTAMAVVGNTTVGGTLGVTGATTLAGVSATTLSASSTVTLSGGTANGVAYLNGSKVVTSGSALTFDGTDLRIGTSSGSFYQGSGLLIQRSGYSTVRFNDTAGTSAEIKYADSLGLVLESVSNRPVVFSVNASEQMRLTSTGLGIGTSSILSKLVVSNGTSKNFEVQPGATTYLLAYDRAASDYLNLDISGKLITFSTNNGAEKMRLDSSGNLGIGTSSPAVKLALKDTSPQIDFITSAASDISASVYGAVDVGTGGKLVFRTKRNGNTPQDVATLDSSGNLGLGVTPSAWGSALKAFENQGGAVTATSSGNLRLYQNSYQNSAGQQIYRNTLAASLYAQDGGSHLWFNAPSGTAGNAITFTQAMTLDASGNLGIGSTSPSNKLVVNGSSGATNIQIADSTASNNLIIGVNTSTVDIKGLNGYPMVFYTANTERARIDSSGNLLVGQTSTGSGGLVNSNSAALTLSSNGSCWTMNHSATSAGSLFAQFGYSGTKIGSITVATSSTVAYNTSSDYRLKENIAPMTGALAKVALLKPCTYTWKIDGSNGQGFIAHELAEVCPEAVTGEKDAVNEDGTINPQGIDTSFLVATLTAAIQELKAEFDAYKASHP